MSVTAGTAASRAAAPRDLVLRVAALMVVAGAWQLATLAADDPVSWPTFLAVLGRLWESWIANPAAWVDSILPSLLRLGAGWAAAVAIGVSVGIGIGRSRAARESVDPAVQFVRSIPPPAFVPLFIALLGIGDATKVTMIAVGAVWPILLNTADGVASVDPVAHDTARVLRLDRRDELFRVVLPAAAPRIFAGLRVSLSIAVILMVLSEMVASVNGIGFELVQAQRTFRSLDVWAAIASLGLIGLGLNVALAAVERRVLRWRAWRAGQTE